MLLQEPQPSLSPPSDGIIGYEKRSVRIRVSLDLASPAVLEAPVFNFPGWRAWIDGSPARIETSPATGAVRVAVPAGRHEVEVRLTNTVARTLGNFTSLAGSIAVLIILVAAVAGRKTGRFRPGETAKSPG
jgi:hypothetical protein